MATFLKMQRTLITRALSGYIIAIGLSLCAFLGAQTPYSLPKADRILEPWRWVENKFAEGLALSHMVELADGTLILGGIDHLIRYDGDVIETYSISEQLMPGAFPEGQLTSVRGMHVTTDQRVLATINNYLVEFKEDRVVLLHELPYNSSLRDFFFQSDDGSIWIKTRRSLSHLSKDFSTLTPQIVLKRRGRLEVTMDSSEAFYIMAIERDAPPIFARFQTANGRIEPREAWDTFPMPAANPTHQSSLLAASDGGVYFADNGSNPLSRLNLETRTWEPVQLPRHSQSHYQLYEDKRGVLWAMGSGEFARFSGLEGKVYFPHQIRLPRRPLKIVETSRGDLWILSGTGKVLTFDLLDDSWKTIPGLHFYTESTDGTQWYISDDNEIYSYEPNTDSWWSHADSEGVISFPRTLLRFSDGSIWALGRHKGQAAISIYDQGTWTRTAFDDFPAFFTGHAHTFDANGNLWLGSHAYESTEESIQYLQLNRDDNGQLVVLNRVDPPDGFRGFTHSLGFTEDGRLWMASNSIRSMYLDGSNHEIHKEFPPIPTRDLEIDRHGAIWIAKSNYGIWQLRDDGWFRHRSTDLFDPNSTSALLALDNGDMLAGNENGVSRFDGVSWVTNVMHPSIHLTDSNYQGGMRQMLDGSLAFNVNSGDWQRRGRDSSGLHTRFASIQYTPEKLPPDTAISSAEELVSHHGNTHIKWTGHDTWNRTPSDELQFSWRLDGGDWSPFMRTRSHTFIDLPSGYHTLEVRTRDNDYNIDPTPASVTFKVELPPWLQWSTLLPTSGILLLGITFIAYIINSRERRLRERNERILDRQKYLEEMDSIKAGYVNNISHELNTPLSAIILTIKKLVDRESDELKHRRLSRIQRNAEFIKNLISQLLLFRQLEQDTLNLNPETGELKSFITQAIDSINPLAELHQISINLKEPDGTVMPLEFDHDLLKRVIENFVSNAIKYNFAGGHVDFAWTVKSEDGASPTLHFSIEDNGRGIPQEHLEHIFDRFYRIEETSLIDGSGIGLNLTKKIVTAMHGEIHVDSPIFDDPDRPGTRITVTIPLTTEKQVILT